MPLAYTDDSEPGYRREADGEGGFRYLDRRGRPIRHPAVLARIRMLAIPPAYEDVWICARANGHLQATGRDARGRKQYRYHDEWIAQRDAHKFGQLAEFGAALPRIRRHVLRDLRLAGVPKARILALVVMLLDHTLIRVGSTQYARMNRSYGLTTLEKKHTRVAGTRIRFQFRGKSGVQHDVTLHDRRLATLLRHCLEIPGQRLFKYRDPEGRKHGISSTDVNTYLQAIGGQDFTAKDFRTWGGSVMAFECLRHAKAAKEPAPPPKREKAALKAVAGRLGNTLAVCRQCYVHPAILEAHSSGRLDGGGPAPRTPRGLDAAERRFLAFLSGWSG